MWRTFTHNKKEFPDIEASEYGVIRYKNTKTIIPWYYDGAGYPYVSIAGVTYKIHRIVASVYIGDTTGKEVHHKDHNRGNPYYKNLIICTRAEHRRYHATTYEKVPVILDSSANKSRYYLTDRDVHKICKLMEASTPYPIIRSKLKIPRLNDSILTKIATQKIWTSVSSQYNIPRIFRSTMNTYSDHKYEIAILCDHGLTVKKIAKKLGYTIDDNKSYTRFYKCMKRYHNKYKCGEYNADLKPTDIQIIIDNYMSE